MKKYYIYAICIVAIMNISLTFAQCNKCPINQPNGIAGLDSQGNVTAAIDTHGLDSSTVALGDLLATGRANFRSMVDGQSIVKISPVHRQINPNEEDPWTDPDSTIFGGFSPGRGSHVVITCQNEGGMNLGACLSIWNSNYVYTGNRPGISPVTGDSIANYGGGFDAVVLDIGTKSTTPKIVAGSNITDSSGIKHLIYFNKGGVYIYPRLTTPDEAKIKQHQTIISNVSNPKYISRKDNYGHYAVNGFSGMINNWQFNVSCPDNFQKGSCDLINVDSWVMPNAGDKEMGQNPQIYATSPSNLDTHYDASAITPTIYIGARTKQFNELHTCSLQDPDSVPGIDGQHSLYRECENTEYDNELYSTISGKYHFNGLTLGVDSHYKGTSWVDGTPQTDGYNAWPDKSSWGMYIGGQFPNLLQLEPFTSPFVYAVKGNALIVTNPISAGNSPSSRALMMSLYKQAGSTNMREDHWEECNAPSGSTCEDHSYMVWRIGLRVNGSSAENEDQMAPATSLSGAPGSNIGFGGDGSTQFCTAAGRCDSITPQNEFIFNNGFNMTNGNGTISQENALVFTSLSQKAYSTLHATSNGTLVIEGTGSLRTNKDLTVGNQINHAVTTYQNLGNTAIQGTERYCSNCSSVNSKSNTQSIPVWWNGNAWTDALGDRVIIH